LRKTVDEIHTQNTRNSANQRNDTITRRYRNNTRTSAHKHTHFFYTGCPTS